MNDNTKDSIAKDIRSLIAADSYAARESKHSCPFRLVSSVYGDHISRNSLSSSYLLQRHDPAKQHHPIRFSNEQQNDSDSLEDKKDKNDDTSLASRKRKYVSNSLQFTPLSTKLPLQYSSNNLSPQSNARTLPQKHWFVPSSTKDYWEESDLSSSCACNGIATVSLSSSTSTDSPIDSITVVKGNQLSCKDVDGWARSEDFPKTTENEKDLRIQRRLLCPVQLLIAILEQGTHESIVAWLPDGRSFVVVDRDRFMSQIVRPSLYKAKTTPILRYDSIVRKLHRLGFARLLPGSEVEIFYHPFFQRDNPDLVILIGRGFQSKYVEKMKRMRLNFPPSLTGVEKFRRR